MLTKTRVRKAVRSLLSESILPMSVTGILKQTADEFEIYPAVPEDQVYSPHREYQAGQTLLYAHLILPSYFVVEQPVTECDFTAKFENGKTKRLPHNDPTDTIYPFTLRGRMSALQEAVTQSLAEMPDVVEIEGLYTLHEKVERVPFGKVSEPQALRELSELADQHCREERIHELSDYCRRHDLSCLYYLSRLENLVSILRAGILAKNLAPSDHATFDDPLYKRIQSKRHRIHPRADLGLNLHYYVPLFFAPKPPLLSLLRDKQHRLVYILIRPDVLLQPGTAFTRKHSLSAEEFFTDIADLEKLDWEVLKAASWYSPDPEEHDRKKKLRQAEALIPLFVPVERFVGVHTCSEDVCQQVARLVSELGCSLPVECHKELYY